MTVIAIETTEFPLIAYHEDGGQREVESAAALRKLGAKWSRVPNETHVSAIRQAAGAVAQVITLPLEAPSNVRQ